jgi:hypothetical protein
MTARFLPPCGPGDKMFIRAGTARRCPCLKVQKAAGQDVQWLTDLLTKRLGTRETAWDTGDAQRVLCLVSETRRNVGDGGDARRSAHNPEVAGSNPAPATKARGPFSNREGAFCLWFVTDLCTGARSSLLARVSAAVVPWSSCLWSEITVEASAPF